MSATVLLVDDEPVLLDVLERYLNDDGFRVVRARDGPSAIVAFQRCTPDLVVLDVELPGYSGTEVLRRIRATGSVPVIMLTASIRESDRIAALALGADDYVSKPFSPHDVVARIARILRGRAASSTVYIGSSSGLKPE